MLAVLSCCWICTGCATWPNTMSSVAYHYVSSLLVRGRSHHCIWGKGQGSVHSNQFRRRLSQKICTLRRIFPRQTPMSMYPLLTCSMLDVKLEWQKPKMPKHECQHEMGVLPIPAGVWWSLSTSCSLLSVVLGMIPAGRYLPAMAGFPPRFPLCLLSPWSWWLSSAKLGKGAHQWGKLRKAGMCFPYSW